MKYILSILCILSVFFAHSQNWESSEMPSDIEQIAVNADRFWLIGTSQLHGRGLYRKASNNWEFLKGISPKQIAISKTQGAVISQEQVAWHDTGTQWIKLAEMNQSSAVAFQQETLWIIDNNNCYQLKGSDWSQEQPEGLEVKALSGGANTERMAFIDDQKGEVWLADAGKNTSLALVASYVALDEKQVWAIDANGALQVYQDQKWKVMEGVPTLKQVATSKINEETKLWVVTSQGNILSKLLSQENWEAVAVPKAPMADKPAIISAEINEKDKEGNTPLMRAIRDQKVEEAGKMIAEMGADVNIPNKDKETPLMLAVKDKKTALATQIIEKGADVNLSDKEGTTALMLAIETQQADLASKIMQAGAELNASNKLGETSLMLAINSKQATLAQQIIEAGADVTIDNKQGETALMLAVVSQQVDLVKVLVEKGADLNELDKNKNGALSLATRAGHEELVRFMLEKGADVSKGDPLIVAVSGNDSTMVNILLEAKANPSTALLEAANTDNTVLFKRLIEAGGELPNNDPLEAAIGKGNLAVTTMALQHGGNANKGLEWAIAKGDKSLVVACLDNGAKANPVFSYAISKNDKALFTEAITKYEGNAQKSLDAAMEANSIPFGEISIANGADPNRPMKEMVEAENSNNVEFLLKSGGDATKALGYAVDADKVKMAEMAFKYEAKVTSNFWLDTSVKNKNLALATLLVANGADPSKSIMLAVKDAQTDMVKMFLDKGADATSKKLIQEASEQGNVAIAQMLLQKGANASEGMKPAVKNNHTQVVELLLVSGAQAIDPYYIETAAGAGNMDMAQMLLDKKANPDAGMPNAVGNGHAEMVEMLLSAGASAVNDSYMVTAVSKDYYKIAKALVGGKCPISYVSPEGKSLLHIASANGSAAMAGLMLEGQLDINKKDKDGNTPLHLAVGNKGSIELVQLLAQKGADINAKNNKGDLVYKEAKGGEIKRYLKSLGAEKK